MDVPVHFTLRSAVRSIFLFPAQMFWHLVYRPGLLVDIQSSWLLILLGIWMAASSPAAFLTYLNPHSVDIITAIAPLRVWGVVLVLVGTNRHAAAISRNTPWRSSSCLIYVMVLMFLTWFFTIQVHHLLPISLILPLFTISSALRYLQIANGRGRPDAE